jgi:hypothetical protein
MALGDGIRRNIADVEPIERALLRDALVELNHRYYPGARSDTPPGGVSWWFKQDEIHQATHVHGGPEFVPWHRELVNRLEELLRQINPQLSLHYWDFADDPTNIPTANLGSGTFGPLNLFDTVDPARLFMGAANGPAGPPWSTAGFYDPQAGQTGHPQDRDAVGGTPADPPSSLERAFVGGSLYPLADISGGTAFGTVCPSIAINNDADILSAATYPEFRVRLECVHNFAHGHIGGTIQIPHISFRDPFVFLLHSNVDRLFAQWQTDPAYPERLNPASVYGSESSLDVTIPDPFESGMVVQNLTHLVEPWSTGIGHYHSIRPWEPTHENQGAPHDYHDISIVAPPCYDTNLSSFRIDEVENPLNASTGRYKVVFNDVPEEETTWRAAVIRVYTCPDTTFRVKAGTEPGAPFGIAVDHVTAVHGAHPHAFQDLRIWFQYTAGALGTAPHTDGPVSTTIRCDETGQEFQFELLANTIHRPTVAVQMVLDQSGSMAWPAGTSGLTRLSVLKDAANLFATLIQANNGLGIVRFDQDAYPPDDPTYPGLSITKILTDADRDTAHAAINAHGAHGETSVGDGLIMGHDQLIALPAGSYDNRAILLLTDGIENQPQSIAYAVGGGFVDNPAYAVGLGNEFQVNTAALNEVTGSVGGNLLLSGVLTSGTDDYFRVKKFFLQILAGVTNTSIVRDPVGYINLGDRIAIPYQLSETDINCRLILLSDFPVLKLSTETPNGTIITQANGPAIGATFATVGTTKTCSFSLPVALPEPQAGTWIAVLEMDRARYKRALKTLEHSHAATGLNAKGARYCLTVHAFSNLRMATTLTQSGYDPGSTFTIRAMLTEYDVPIDRRAAARAHLEYPDHTTAVLPLNEIRPGVFEGTTTATLPGIYRVRVLANGVTYRGTSFTREELRTAAVFHNIDWPPIQPGVGITRPDLCQLVTCLLSDKNLSSNVESTLRERGINWQTIRDCLDQFCRGA